MTSANHPDPRPNSSIDSVIVAREIRRRLPDADGQPLPQVGKTGSDSQSTSSLPPSSVYLANEWLEQFLPIIDDAAFHDATNLSYVADILQRIRVEHHEIGKLAGLHAAE